MLGKTREVGIIPLMKVLRLEGMSILDQLHLEERLLRTSSDNWCLINDGTTSPSIVMGLSGYVLIFLLIYTLITCKNVYKLFSAYENSV